jgi:hypothetical protein
MAVLLLTESLGNGGIFGRGYCEHIPDRGSRSKIRKFDFHSG